MRQALKFVKYFPESLSEKSRNPPSRKKNSWIIDDDVHPVKTEEKEKSVAVMIRWVADLSAYANFLAKSW